MFDCFTLHTVDWEILGGMSVPVPTTAYTVYYINLAVTLKAGPQQPTVDAVSLQ